MGDLNINQLSDKDSTHGLVTICQSYHMDQLIHTPTRITAHSKSLLDVLLTSNKKHINDSGVLIHAMSDHSAVYCIHKATLKPAVRHITYRNMKTFSPDKLHQDLQLVPYAWSVCDIFDDVDDRYYVWNSLFTEVVNDHAPLKTRRCKKSEVPWISWIGILKYAN